MPIHVNKILTLVLVFLVLTNFYCKTTVQNKKSQINNEHIIKVVNIYRLIDNIKKYHGLTVQTTGYFNVRFEDCSLSKPNILFTNNTFSFSIKEWPSLWVEFDYDSVLYRKIETLPYLTSGRLTTLQGVIDTSNTGHMGVYAGALIHTKIVEAN